ncbi:hypothetical protein JG687_00016322 [Phytophthora cactorum]|uniref:Uncharacterized protein n=1 Tax=Phytophthora cactorum TaxID=29920 RepID=A0A8T1TUS0_9STRA|nr:hypothetical protein JG687_00016322 [Phytophthora cactorum]
MLRLRSGRVRPHPLVVEDAAIQIAALAELEPAKPATSNDPNRLSPSGDTTVIPWVSVVRYRCHQSRPALRGRP